MKTKLLLLFTFAFSTLAGCGSSSDDSGTKSDSPSSTSPSPGSGTNTSAGDKNSGSSSSPSPPPAAAATCDAQHELFACDDSKSCMKDTDFCDMSGPTGATCRSFGGDGSSCPSTCDDFYKQFPDHCGPDAVKCEGSAEAGFKITCVPG
jgi:hypothetical protein